MKTTINFWRDQRIKLGLSLTQMAARVDSSAQTVLNWENDETLPSKSSAELAAGYEVSESRIDREFMAMRKRIALKKTQDVVASK